MNKNQSQLIEFISSAIRGKELNDSIVDNVQWKSLIKSSEDHKIAPLLFYSIRNSYLMNEIDINDFNALKKRSIVSSIMQIQHANQIKRLFTLFYDNNIKAIALKGMILRELYPNPEFRSMSDCDILVHEMDLEKVSELLLKEGYYQIGATKEHLTFKHEKHFLIDLHWTLEDKRGISDISKFELEIWKNTIYVQCGNTSLLSLSWEDMLVHLCMHMAGHTKSGGFGIRQLCDIVLLIENKTSEINWDSFLRKVRENGIEKFTFTVLLTCNKLFKLEIPIELDSTLDIDDKYLDMFINYVINGGVYGKRDLVNSYSNSIVYNSIRQSSNNSSDIPDITKQFILMFFPKIQKLKDKYEYARRYTILIPIAWANHIFSNIFSNNSNLFHKMKSLFFLVPLSKKRYKLFKYLEL